MKTKLLLIIVSVFMLTTGVVRACRNEQPLQVAPVLQSDKLDAECNGNETSGRCIDKQPFVCPDDTTPVDEANHICAPNPPDDTTPAVVTEQGAFGK